jgi:hypothetical protein
VKYQGSISDLKVSGSVTNFVLHVTGGPDVRVQTSQPLPAGTKAGDIVQIEGEETNDPPFIATGLWKVGSPPTPKPLPWKWIAAAVAILIVLFMAIYALMQKSGGASGGNYYTLQIKFNSQYLASTNCASNVSLQADRTTPNPDCASWQFVPDPRNRGWMRIQLKRNGLYLTMPQCGSPAVLTTTVTDASEDCQLWRFSPATKNNAVPASKVWSRLQSKHGNQYIDAAYCQPTFGLNPGSTYDGGACELFSIAPAP